MKRVFIVHGWEGHPNEHWIPWLKKKLEKRDFLVEAPQMPETEHPKIDVWVPFLAKLVGIPDEDTYFVGHSIGCQTIIRYLETVKGRVGGAVFVGGWLTLTPMATRTPEDQAIARPWLEKPIDWTKVKKTVANAVVFLADNDPYVPVENGKTFEQKLGAKVTVEKGKGHFTKDDGVTEVPEVLEALLAMSNR